MIIINTTIAAGCLIYLSLYKATYKKTCNRSPFWRNKSVLVIVPHQDDELNIAGGVIEQYVKAGSEVSVAYITNGDLVDRKQRRLIEALDCMKSLGVKEDHVYFFGYGDSWGEKDMHIYLSGDPNTTIPSQAGHTSTYALIDHPDYHSKKFGIPARYTKKNYLADIKELIHDINPELIFCIDCDAHPDHRAVSFAVEEVIRELICENSGITSKLRFMKGFGYSTAYHAPGDYYHIPILDTLNPTGKTHVEETIPYDFEERVRFPVASDILGYTKRGSSMWRNCLRYNSQGIIRQFLGIVNSDKVFFERRLDNLALSATVTASSGNCGYLNNFKRIDYKDFRKTEGELAYNGWIPDSKDETPNIRMTWKEEKAVKEVVLYPLPSSRGYISQMQIQVGAESRVIDTEAKFKKNCPFRLILQEGISASSIEFKILKKLDGGGDLGLSEIEVYPPENEGTYDYIKLVDEDSHFIYNILLRKPKELRLKVYYSGYLKHDTASSELLSKLDIQILGREKKNVLYKLAGDTIVFASTPNRLFRVRVSLNEHGDVKSDDVIVWRPYVWERAYLEFCIGIEKRVSKYLDRLETKAWHLRSIFFRALRILKTR